MKEPDFGLQSTSTPESYSFESFDETEPSDQDEGNVCKQISVSYDDSSDNLKKDKINTDTPSLGFVFLLLSFILVSIGMRKKKK